MALDDSIGRIRDLKERILAVESHALAIKRSVPADVQRAEAEHVITTLQLLEIAIRGTPSANVVRNAEELFSAARARLARVAEAS